MILLLLTLSLSELSSGDLATSPELSIRQCTSELSIEIYQSEIYTNQRIESKMPLYSVGHRKPTLQRIHGPCECTMHILPK